MNRFRSTFCVLLFPFILCAQYHPVVLRVIDKTFGVKTSNDKSSSNQNVVAGLSEDLKFQGEGTGNWYYPLFKMPGTTGEVLKNDTAWIWQASIQAPVGIHSWKPCLKSIGYKPLNKTVAYYGENDELEFSVNATGKVDGITEIVIEDEQYPVTLKIIDKTKGIITNDIQYDQANVYFTGGKPLAPTNALTDLHNEFILHKAQTEFAADEFDFVTGVNIGVWLSQTSNRGSTSAQNYFKKSDLKQLADMGFDHIRLPVDEKEIFDTNMEFVPATRQLVHDAIAWCKEYNMRLVLDLHILRSHYFNDDKNSIILWKDPAEQDKLVAMWDKLSQEYGHYSNNMLAYELLNEANAPNAEVWNKLAARIIAKIREREPDRYLILGGINHNSADALSSLEVPQDDKKLLLAFHFYSPHLLTHYQANWMDGLKNLRIPLHYPGQLVAQEDVDTITVKRHRDVVNYYNGYNNKSTLKTKLQNAIDRANSLGLRLYCSEYGCITNTPNDVKQRYLRDVSEVFRENNIAFSIWGWKANFGILDNSGNVRSQEVIDAIACGGGNKYNMFPHNGNVVEKNDTAWIWSATVYTRTGCSSWKPFLYSTGLSLNEISHYDNAEGDMQFNVDLQGNMSGHTTLIVPDGLSAFDLEVSDNGDGIFVYPTLFADHISVKGLKKYVQLYNMAGVKVAEGVADSELMLDTSDLSKGTYVLRVDDKYSYKLMK